MNKRKDLKGRKKSNNSSKHILSRVAHEITSDSLLAGIASVAVKGEVDYIYGYEKYSLEEIASELEQRLYDPTYLGCALNAILKRPEVSEAQKAELAESYLDIVVSYLAGDLPEETQEYWGDGAEPYYVVEAAAYLAETEGEKIDWVEKKERLRSALSFTEHSGVEAKKSLLRKLVEKLNEEQRTGFKIKSKEKDRLTDLLSGEDLKIESRFGFLKEKMVTMATGERVEKRKLRLLTNLSVLADAQGSESSAGELCRLSSLEKNDLLDIFAEDVLFLFLRRTPANRTMMYYDVAKVLYQERGITFASMVQALAKKIQDEDEKRGRSLYEEEPKLKALCKLSLEIGENQNGDFLGLITNVLKLKRIETSTRLSLFKFLYENLRSQDERDKILNEAVRFKSGHIRAWATSEIKTNRK